MCNDKSFPAGTVVTSFLQCEEQLARVLKVLPYCPEHEEVWSPILASLLMDACSQLDSLWGHTAWLSECVRKDNKRRDLGIKNYFEYFGEYVKDRWVVFWPDEPVKIQPFQAWDGASEYEPLAWWQAYNQTKHDRLANLNKATLSATTNAIAGLFLAILRCEYCRYAVEAADWLSSSDAVAHNPKAWLDEDSGTVKDTYIVAETKLFAYPVGWCDVTVAEEDLWIGNASWRFRQWFSRYSSE